MARDGVFICYRRGDAGATADRLALELKRSLGGGRVFLDTQDIHGGQPFPERIQEALDRARLLLVVMGKDWLKSFDEHGRRRIDDENDWVHREIAGGSEAVT